MSTGWEDGANRLGALAAIVLGLLTGLIGMAQAGSMSPRDLPGWSADRVDAVRPALEAQCRLARPPEGWGALCAQMRASTDFRAWLEHRFVARPLSSAKGDKEGLITGYHEPLLTGSRVRETPSQVALFQLPSALDPAAGGRRPTGRTTVWHSRAEIESGAIAGLEPIVWLDDPVEAFFLHVQGSGRVRLRDGQWLRAAYAGHNGQTYKAIGKVLVDRGELTREQADAPGIKAWLRRNPDRAIEVMHTNPRFVFFRALKIVGNAEPAGSLGVPLTPGRSIATDRAHITPGSMVFIDTTEPVSGQPLRALTVSQDTGGAIVGAVRADVYWGSGDLAEQRAGRMRHPGRLWVLSPRENESGPPARP